MHKTTRVFSYFGSKAALARFYPAPIHEQIIEPFAGGAAYALRYWRGHRVWLNDLDSKVARAWSWLTTVHADELRALPRLQSGTRLSTLSPPLSPDARLWLMLNCNAGAGGTANRDVVTQFASVRIKMARLAVANLLPHIRDWRITHGDYLTLPDVEATWFIDPPYQTPGTWYSKSADQINYRVLAEWCRSRRGQVIVCEQSGAQWLPFTAFRSMLGTAQRKSSEVVWLSDRPRRTPVR